MKIILIGLCLFLLLLSNNTSAQEIYGNWVCTKTTYLNDTELSKDNPLANQYLKFTFDKPFLFSMSLTYDTKKTHHFFNINSNILKLLIHSNGALVPVNSFLIDKLTGNELVLIQKGNTDYSEKECLKYHFIRENAYKNLLPLKSSYILSINKNDTVYISSQKINALFVNYESFYEFCMDNIAEKDALGSKFSLFLATFIVRKTGQIDSVHILENINPRFGKQFLKALEKSKIYWIPAETNGRKVDVQEKIIINIGPQGSSVPVYDFIKKGKDAMKKSDFSGAITYFNIALEITPDDYNTLCSRAICETKLGNKDAALEDFEKVKESGKVKLKILPARILK